MRRRVFLSSLAVAAASGTGALAQIKGKPTNLDEHGNMVMPKTLSGEDAATMHIESPARKFRAVAPAGPKGVTPVLTRSFDNLRSGANTQETVLTPAAVQQRGMRKLFSIPVLDDARGCEAQPLLIPNVTVEDGTVHDVCLITSMSNKVQAHDANTGEMLWATRLGNPIPGSPQIDGWMINDHWGILSTGVVDAAAGVLYCVSWSDPNGNWKTAAHTFHSLKISDGTPAAPPINLSGVTYNPGHGLPVQSFQSSERKQRASLLLATIDGKASVLIAFGTIQETSDTARGWIVAIDVASNAVGAAWTATSRYSGGGIWQAGQGLSCDGKYLYCLTGNGSFDAITEWSECALKLQYVPPSLLKGGSISVVDWWSPFSDSGRAGGPQTGTHITTDNGGGWDDMDLGSGGIVVVPSLSLILACGKDGIGYVLNSQNLGKTQPGDFANPQSNYDKAKWIGWWTYYNPNTPRPNNFTDLNTIYGGRTHHQHSTPVVFNGPNGYRVYCAGENSNVRVWSMDNSGQMHYLGCSVEYSSPEAPVPPGGMPGMMMSLSANGTQNAILWATCPMGDANRSVTQGILYAFDASNLQAFADGSGHLPLLWQSARYTFNKFCPVVVSGGKVYVTTYSGSVDVYALQ